MQYRCTALNNPHRHLDNALINCRNTREKGSATSLQKTTTAANAPCVYKKYEAVNTQNFIFVTAGTTLPLHKNPHSKLRVAAVVKLPWKQTGEHGLCIAIC